MFQNNNHHHTLPSSLSDNETDELGRMRVRARRKQKKLDNKQFIKKLRVKYWMLLIILSAVFLLFATRIGLRPSSNNIAISNYQDHAITCVGEMSTFLRQLSPLPDQRQSPDQRHLRFPPLLQQQQQQQLPPR